MLQFSLDETLDEQVCHNFLLRVLHPDGLHCPHGHPLPGSQAPHDRHRAPILDYRYHTCGAVFNLFNGTVWAKSRYRCATMVQILRGIAQGVPTKHLAEELGIDRGTCWHGGTGSKAWGPSTFPPWDHFRMRSLRPMTYTRTLGSRAANTPIPAIRRGAGISRAGWLVGHGSSAHRRRGRA